MALNLRAKLSFHHYFLCSSTDAACHHGLRLLPLDCHFLFDEAIKIYWYEFQTPQCDAVGSTAIVAVVTPDRQWRGCDRHDFYPGELSPSRFSPSAVNRNQLWRRTRCSLLESDDCFRRQPGTSRYKLCEASYSQSLRKYSIERFKYTLKDCRSQSVSQLKLQSLRNDLASQSSDKNGDLSIVLDSQKEMAQSAKPISSPVPVSMYPTLAFFMIVVGLVVTASFFIYEATSSRKNRSLAKELTTTSVPSVFMGFGSLFLLLTSGVFV
nr:transmembrane protein 258-like [Ipomoea batatas]